MGEHKQPNMRKEMARLLADKICKVMADDGKLVEMGYVAFELLLLQEASPAQRSDMRLAYMAGAQHLFASIMNIMDPGEEPTERDLKRLDLINNELDHWSKVIEAYYEQRSAGRQ